MAVSSPYAELIAFRIKHDRPTASVSLSILDLRRVERTNRSISSPGFLVARSTCIRLLAVFGSGTRQNKIPRTPRWSGAARATKSSSSATER